MQILTQIDIFRQFWPETRFGEILTHIDFTKDID